MLHPTRVLAQGPTPIVMLSAGSLQILAKLEYLHPTLSVKDRIGGALIDELISSGRLTSSTRWVVEATAGNTALALAEALRTRGLPARVVAVVSDKVQETKICRMRSQGIVVRVVPYEVGEPRDGHPAPLIEALYETQARLPDSVLAGQFTSPANPAAHEDGTGAELVAQLDEPPDAFVCGAGTGGTITGVTRAIRRAGWPTKVVLADPQGSILGAAWRGDRAEPGKSVVEGIGGDFVPSILDLEMIDTVISVPDTDSLAAAQRLRAAGFAVGNSSGCAVAAALAHARSVSHVRSCIVLFADHGSSYS